MPSLENKSKIAELNDALRTTLAGGRVLMSRAIAALPHDVELRIIERMRAFDEFNEDNDPHGEHDCAIFEAAGHRCMFKIDYYDESLEFGSDDPADAEKTTRVLTLMLASDY